MAIPSPLATALTKAVVLTASQMGYAAMPLIQHQVVDIHPWLTMTQFVDIITIAEMTQGPIAVNSATFVGIQVAGVPGAVIASVGCILPSCVIVMILAYVYYYFRGLTIVRVVLAGMRPAVVAMIASAGISLIILSFYGQRTLPEDMGSIDYISVLIFGGALVILRKWKVNPMSVAEPSAMVWVRTGTQTLVGEGSCPFFCVSDKRIAQKVWR